MVEQRVWSELAANEAAARREASAAAQHRSRSRSTPAKLLALRVRRGILRLPSPAAQTALKSLRVAIVSIAGSGAACATPCVDDGFLSMQHDEICQAMSATETATATATTTSGSETDTGGPTQLCRDEDMDGQGNPDECIPAQQPPPPGYVPNDLDCNDLDPMTFVGAAELEDPDACMTDPDDDGWGSDVPSPGAAAGTDCAGENPSAFPGSAQLDDPNACMEDEDNDGWGDVAPPAGVAPGTDCDDLSATTFPGAAPLDDPEACMKDDDDDDYGDDDPQVPGVVPGVDCDDSDADILEECDDCEPNAKFCLGDDVYLCNMMGDGAQLDEVCDFGCDLENPACVEELTLDVGESICIDQGAMTQLQGMAAGGDGVYIWDWTPADSLDDPSIDSPLASPEVATTYEVTVTDGLNSTATESISVFVNDTPLALSDEACATAEFTWDDEDKPLWSWDPNLSELSQSSNSGPSARLCNWSLDNANLTGRLEIKAADNDDYVGFLWGVQPFDPMVEEPSKFYFMGWKQGSQPGSLCPEFPLAGAAGIQVHRIDVLDPINNPLNCGDLHNPEDTENSTVLANEAEFTTQGWLDDVAYIVDLTHTKTGFTVKVSREDNEDVIAEKEFIDDTYPGGTIGFYTYSQDSVCFSDFQADCL